MSLIQAIILGIIQGLTEFIPVSSSAHLIVIPWLAHWPDPGMTFDVALHLGTLIALLWFFRADWIRLVRAGVKSIAQRKIGSDLDRRLFWFLIIGTIPGIIVGYFGESTIEELFHKSNTPNTTGAMVAMAVIIGLLGVMLFAAERIAKHLRGLNEISLKDAIVIGLSQALAIFPGVSRSGITITAGLALGLQRETSARFSFLLSPPIILGAGLKSFFDVRSELATGAMVGSDLLAYIIGFITAAVSGYLCIKFLLRFLQKHSTDIFAYYRWLLAALIIIVALVRR